MPAVGDVGIATGLRVRPAGARPVVLATFDVPFAAEAAELAVDAAVEAGQGLVVVNVSPVALLPMSLLMGYAYIETDDLRDALRAPAELAASFNIPVELLRVSSPHPADALLEVVSERNPSLLVLGPDLATVRRRLYRKAVRRIRERATCLVWLETMEA
jgi:nucleotide-binding universal stress UspA family protein